MKNWLWFLLTTLSLSICAQPPLPQGLSYQDGSAPTVFLIGQNERSYEHLLSEYNHMLLSICNNDMEAAYTLWIDFLVQLENFAKEKEMDILGVKLWLNVFWNADGSIDNIVYHPKPNSKNIDLEKLSALFNEFIKNYTMKITSQVKYSHYSSASFPVFPRRYPNTSASQ